MSKLDYTTGSGFEAKQPIILEASLYGAMFARYEPSREVEFEGVKKVKTPVSFVITHSASGKQLPQFSEGFKMIANSLFFNEKTGKRSIMVEFLSAILKDTKFAMSASELVKHADLIPDLDEIIGYPVQLLIEPAAKPSSKGIIYNQIKQFVPVSKDLRATMAELYRTAVFGQNEKTGHKQLLSPQPCFEGEEVPPAVSAAGVSDEELPF